MAIQQINVIFAALAHTPEEALDMGAVRLCNDSTDSMQGLSLV